MEIKNLKKAAERIKKAVKNKEKIILYGDADLDGVSSVIILKETIKNLGGEVSAIHFPDRERERYGINKEAINYLKNKVPALLIALDCGIGNFEEIKLAKKLGFEVIIIDHHEILEKLPEASVIVDPKQNGDKYHFKEFAAAGIVFKLSQLLLGKKLSGSLRSNFLELTALATISDMMPAVKENKIFIDQGLKSLEKTFRPGLKIFWQINSIKNYGSLRQIVQRIISTLNASDADEGHLNESYLLLTETCEEKAKRLAINLLEKSYQRQLRIREITAQVEERILEKPKELIVFEGDPSWALILAGPVASRICNRYKKPVFLFKKGESESSGAVRMPQGLDGVKAMISCKSLLETYGGHPPAAGFRIKNKNLEKFKKCLIKHFSSN
ncbi:MAG: hypothetical protein COY73_00830 [Candidatus Nealsonbacteria bacterium CG_4_10_14_0_8_um_filter_37_14]|uniref:Single-stranded-DNA-specific exonuclease RecJ n=1 Tax=Candidatus Nealsonbacteria bacterium CG_4_10_14_0_8_um_filter_37_14 TaxID=1974684 RepID=A0A2M7R844_9BACT|nr:MAG: hypothetical protein COY73_00830 [Candidatus Nealsonbacteria bacterium CG_4_10_14_0_8_um_filter_37_14]